MISTEFALLQVLIRGPGHGYELATRVQERTGAMKKISAGSLYPTLRRMESDGLIRAVEGEEHPITGRPRVVYELTGIGAEKALSQANSVRGLLPDAVLA